jgi:uncharacterized protein YhfF
MGMTAEELWKQSGLTGIYEAWAFGEAPDKLASLVKDGIKTATCSAYDLYEAEGESLPAVGAYSVILDSHDEAVCIIRTKKVYVVEFDQVTEEHAWREGEGDRSLEYWRKVHEDFLSKELATINRSFNGKTKVVIMVPAEISKEDAIEAGKAALGNKLTGSIIKEIYVPGKIINIVAK